MAKDTTLTSKGQTTIPKAIRDGLKMKPGDRMTFTLMPDGTVILRTWPASFGRSVANRSRPSACLADARSRHERARALLVRDHEARFDTTRRLIQREAAAGERVFVSLLVLLETEWVLRSRYALSKTRIAGILSALLDTMDLQFEHEPAIEEALFYWKDTTSEFADCLIGAHHRRLGCSATRTFDAKARRLPHFVGL